MDPHSQVDRIRNVLAIALVGAFVGALIRFSFQEIPAGSKDIVNYMVGQLSGMALMALGFYFTNKAGQDAVDAKRADTSAKMADAVQTALKTGDKGHAAERAADDVAGAAVAKAEKIKGASK